MKKFSFKTSLFLVILVLASLMAGCSSNESDSGLEAPEGTVAVTNDAVHFYVCYPQDWLCTRNDGMITMSPPVDSGSKATVSIRESKAMLDSDIWLWSKKDGDESAESVADDIPVGYWEQSALKELENSGIVYKIIDTENVKLGGMSAYRVNYSMDVNNETYSVTQIFAYKNIDSSHRIFTVTFTASQKDKENSNVISAYNKILSNFNFKED